MSLDSPSYVTLVEPRASTLLFNFLVSNKKRFRRAPFLLPANVCPIVPLTFKKAGVNFVFQDVEWETQSLDKNKVIELIINKPNGISGILFVHSYGQSLPVKEFYKELKSIYPELVIIDDRCLSKPITDKSRFDGSSDLILFSTGYSKFVEFNEGGYAFCLDEFKYKTHPKDFNAEHLKVQTEKLNFAISNGTEFLYEDSNWLDFQLGFKIEGYFERINAANPLVEKHKRRINEVYRSILPKEIVLRPGIDNWRFNIKVKNKKEVIQQIFQAGLFASAHYYPSALLFSRDKQVNASKWHTNVVNLFNDFRIDEESAALISKVILQHYKPI